MEDLRNEENRMLFAVSSDTVYSKKDFALYKFIFVLILVICAMRIVFKDGKMYHRESFTTIRERLAKED